VEPIEIWPLGAIELGAGQGVLAGCVMIELTDQSSGQIVRIMFRDHAFVTFADHLKMAGDAVLDGSFRD
jgi:hypothetical protein